MIKVYFESSNDGETSSGTYAEQVAEFYDENTYNACLPALEALAKEANMTITESVNEHSQTLVKSEYNKRVIENFILHFTHESREQATEYTEAIEMYQSLDDYIEDDHVDGIEGDEEGSITIG